MIPHAYQYPNKYSVVMIKVYLNNNNHYLFEPYFVLKHLLVQG